MKNGQMSSTGSIAVQIFIEEKLDKFKLQGYEKTPLELNFTQLQRIIEEALSMLLIHLLMPTV